MSMFQLLKEYYLQARKDKSSGSGRGLHVGLYSSLVSDISRKAKDDGNREPTDADVVKIAQAYDKSVRANLEILYKTDRQEDIRKAEQELEVLETFIPQTLSEEETQEAVEEAVKETDAETMKDMGKVMSVLKEKHGTQLDMQLASKLLKKIIQ